MHAPREVLIQQTRPSSNNGSAEVGNNSSDRLIHCHVTIKHYPIPIVGIRQCGQEQYDCRKAQRHPQQN